MSNFNISIIGASSFAKEVYGHLISDLGKDMINDSIKFFVDDNYLDDSYKVFNKFKVYPISTIDTNNSIVLIAIGDSKKRYQVFTKLNSNIKYFKFIHSSGKILLEDSVSIGEGSIICAGSIITCDVTLGNHTHLNLNTTIGHDTVVGDFFTTAPGVNISGNCQVGNRVYVGTNACIKEKISICDDVIIGMGACVVKDIKESGTYIGIPAKKV
jgi:sugar O-acyltransferase (sialic acid O-acetyltransferase NeuD family)